MKLDKRSLLLYAVTDSDMIGPARLEEQAEKVLAAGATFLQLREKDLPSNELVAEGKRLREIARRHGVPFVIDDNVEAALSSGADGVHVGQSDRNAAEVRALLGPDKILGVSAQTVEQAVLAERDGADYLGVGAVFPTSTKADADSVSYETLQAICRAVKIPVVAIGGIQQSNLPRLRGSGIAGVAVVSAIFAQPDAAAATQALLKLAEETVG